MEAVNLPETNIDAFDIAASEIFAALYDAFPIRIDLKTASEEMEDSKNISIRVPNIPWQLHSVIDERELQWDRVLVDDLCERGRLQDLDMEDEGIREFYASLDLVKNEATCEESRFERLKRMTLIKRETADWLCQMGYISNEEEKISNFQARVDWTYDKSAPTYSREHVQAYYANIDYSILCNARLTSKGLEALRAVPNSLIGSENEASLGEQLKNQVGQVGSEVRKQAISKIIGEVIGHAVGAMTGQV